MYKVENGRIVQYDANGKLIRTFNQENNDTKDGLRINNSLKRGKIEDLVKAYNKWLETGIVPSAASMGLPDAVYDTLKRDIEFLATQDGLDFNNYSGKKQSGVPLENNVLNPYTAYLENQRQKQENAELGLLNETTKANVQNAEISAQQSMIQQAQLKDQIVEQIKTDRLSKMRAGLTPMQIAQEDLQFMVGNMQGNNQNMQIVNQQRLAAQQQQAMNPYQAYINSNAAVTGQQGYVNVASGFAATDAGDLYQQALRIARTKGRTAPSNEDLLMAQGQANQK